MQRYFTAASLVLTAWLAACTTQPPATDQPPDNAAVVPPKSRYAVQHDFAPLKPISPEEVVDAIPLPDPILAAGNMSPYVIDGVTYEVLKDYRGYRERGIASWYGAKFTGHETSNGELYDVYQASAAHKSLPIPCFARVTNLDNGKSIVVRVNDRGPFHADRLIDLSYAAAVKLGYMEKGIAQVEVEVIDVVGVDDRRDASYGKYRYLQLGAFGSETTAKTLLAELQNLLSAPVFISPVDAGGTMLYRVRVGPVDDKEHLLALQQRLQDSGYEAGQPLP
ncbi:Endolytic peptidoglycan transglycosylase RlpA [Halioglobus japonicus]|nr:Endolytic peptidoglycan transglycosylase RlpA [Halioglobus japonicus]